WLAGLVENYFPQYRRLKPLQVVETFKQSVFFELDLRFEAAAAAEMAENITKHSAGLRVPAVHWELTSRRVLTMDWVDGIAFSNIEAIRASGFSTESIMSKAAQSLFSQVFKDGFFHADLHPGNLFLDKNGDLVAVDFGIMGRLSIESRMYIAEILRGFLVGDYKRVAQVHFDAGYVPASKSLEAFTQACMAVARPITGKPLSEISIAKLLGQMFKIAAEFEMEVQPQLLLMQKTLMVAEGVGRMLDPHLNMWQLATPMIEEWANEHFGVQGKLKDAARHGQDALRKLPFMLAQAGRVLEMVGDERGLKIHPASLELLEKQRSARLRPWLYLAWAALAIAALMAVDLLHLPR
ncbi:MAG: 2-polyprenylphenol 6-hydroxylase, partial [Alphaproteobacteria bacterium]|nr:2-polyprenylphenol 6-hydroxylase [Alphaproteobacteria bacterium]